MRARVGTSGWVYPHWRTIFYPDELPSSRWLPYYAARFDTVEINSSFYRLPEAETFARWAAQVPAGFRFAVKASRYITHLKHLRDCAQPLALFFDRAARLGRAFGPVLYQLPATFHRNDDRLAEFLALLPPSPPQVMELRHPSWRAPAIDRLLAAHHVARCLTDGDDPRALVATAPHVYLRVHQATHTPRALARFADALAELCAHRALWVYFNNDGGGHALVEALRMRDLLGAPAPAHP